MKGKELACETSDRVARFKETNLSAVLDVFKNKFHIHHKDAWVELYSRYNSRILKIVKKSTYEYKYDSPEQLAEDITHIVFNKMLTQIDQFGFDEGVPGNPEKEDINFMRWIWGLIRNAFIDEVRRNNKAIKAAKEIGRITDISYKPEDQEIILQNLNEEATMLLIRKASLDLALKSLTDEEVDIILYYRDYGRIEQGKWILDMPHKAKLMKKHNLKSNSLDQKKLRIVQKLKKLILSG